MDDIVGGSVSGQVCSVCNSFMIYGEFGDADSDKSTIDPYCEICKVDEVINKKENKKKENNNDNSTNSRKK